MSNQSTKTLTISPEFQLVFKKQMNKAIGDNSCNIKLCDEIIKFTNDVLSLNVNYNIPKNDMEIGFISYMGKLVNFHLNDLEEFMEIKHKEQYGK